VRRISHFKTKSFNGQRYFDEKIGGIEKKIEFFLQISNDKNQQNPVQIADNIINKYKNKLDARILCGKKPWAESHRFLCEQCVSKECLSLVIFWRISPPSPHILPLADHRF
jgi:hypothetical protein